MDIEPTYQCLQLTRIRFQRYGLILEKTGLNRTVRIRIRAKNPHLHNFISKSLRGRVESFMDIEPTYECLQLTSIRFQRYGLILEKNWLEEECADKNQGQ